MTTRREASELGGQVKSLRRDVEHLQTELTSCRDLLETRRKQWVEVYQAVGLREDDPDADHAELMHRIRMQQKGLGNE